MAIYSIITIQFTEELTVGQQVGFDINIYPLLGVPSTFTMIENVVTLRTTSLQMTAATTSTGIVGEQTAINYYNALVADLWGYTITRTGNTVSVRGNSSYYGYQEFYVNGFFASYDNPESVLFTTANNISDFSITSVIPSTSSTPCDTVNLTIQTTGAFGSDVAVQILEPFSATNSSNPFSFTYSRNESFNLVVMNSLGVTASTSIATPPYLEPELFSFDILYDLLTITNIGYLPTPNQGFLLQSPQYSLDGVTWQTGNTFSGVTGSFIAYVKDGYGCSFSYSETTTIDKNDFILSRSPYYITYNKNANDFDYCTLEMYIWNGDNTLPTLPTYDTLTAYKVKSTDDFLWFEVSDYLRDFLDPQIQMDSTWYQDIDISVDSTEFSADDTDVSVDTNYLTITGGNKFGEVCWAQFILRSYKISFGVGLLVDTIQSPLKVASLGYGYHSEGNNPKPPSNTLVNPVDKYSTNNSLNYLTTIRATASNTDFIIERQVLETDKKLCNWGHKEYQIIYLNKYGVWDSMLFNRVSKRTVELKSETSEYYQSRPDKYSTYSPTTRTSNINAVEEWIINTDLLDDRQNYYLEELIASDRWYLLNQEDLSLIPVVLTDKKFEEKLGYYEQAKLQWTLKFKSANSKINDIR